MYTGKNPSALRSMECLRKSFLSLLEEEKYERVSVKEICSRADLTRQTFYKMFNTKEEIIDYHFSILFGQFAQECGCNLILSEIALAFARFFYENREFIRILVSNKLTYLLEEQFEVYLKKIDLYRRINERERYPDYTTAFIAGALTQILVHWFGRGFDLEIGELGRLIVEILSGKSGESPNAERV